MATRTPAILSQFMNSIPDFLANVPCPYSTSGFPPHLGMYSGITHRKYFYVFQTQPITKDNEIYEFP